MAPLTDPDRLLAYRDAIRNWRVKGFVKFELSKSAYDWIKRELGIALPELACLMAEFVEAGGEVDEVRETRELWSDEYDFHHDLRFKVGTVQVYVETCLHYSVPVQPDTSWIKVVNVHAA